MRVTKHEEKNCMSDTGNFNVRLTGSKCVMADRESDLREEQAWTSQQLDATYARMNALWEQKQQLESQIDSLNSDLVNVMVSIQTLENDIASKEAEIEKTQATD